MQGDGLGNDRDRGLEPDVGGALGEDDAQLDPFVRDALAHLGAFQERHLERVAAALLQFAEELLQVGVPADAEAVVPAAEDGVARLQLEVGFFGVAAVAAGRDVADVVGEVGVQRADFEGHVEGSKGACGWAVVLRCGPSHP